MLLYPQIRGYLPAYQPPPSISDAVAVVLAGTKMKKMTSEMQTNAMADEMIAQSLAQMDPARADGLILDDHAESRLRNERATTRDFAVAATVSNIEVAEAAAAELHLAKAELAKLLAAREFRAAEIAELRADQQVLFRAAEIVKQKQAANNAKNAVAVAAAIAEASKAEVAAAIESEAEATAAAKAEAQAAAAAAGGLRSTPTGLPPPAGSGVTEVAAALNSAARARAAAKAAEVDVAQAQARAAAKAAAMDVAAAEAEMVLAEHEILVAAEAAAATERLAAEAVAEAEEEGRLVEVEQAEAAAVADAAAERSSTVVVPSPSGGIAQSVGGQEETRLCAKCKVEKGEAAFSKTQRKKKVCMDKDPPMFPPLHF